jgi:hypothetical protein
MAQVFSLFDSYEDAEKAVRMLTERGYAADDIRLLMQNRSGETQQVEGDTVAPTQDDDNLLANVARQLPKLAGFLGGLDRSDDVDDPDLAIAQAGVPAARVGEVTAALDAGRVLVSITTDDFRAEDVRNIMDDASGRYMERLLSDENGEASGGGAVSRSSFE